MASLYIHIPFCEHKCIYCDFYSIAPQESPTRKRELVEEFLDALKSEIRQRSQEDRFRVSYETVFFGGGTPSLLSPSSIAEILELVASGFAIQADAEVTLETNPGTVDREKLKEFRAAGVNRLSIGIQSFHDDELRFLTRIHSAAQARECVQDARRSGFENISFDLMFALPSQTLERWESSLRQAVELGPTHISCYSLMVEPNTPLSKMVERKQVVPVSADGDAELYEFTIQFLQTRGYGQYEVSNFAQPGFKSRHNSNYWNHSNYLGLGPSAHSFWFSGGARTAAERWWNIANVAAYAERLANGVVPVAGREELSLEQLIREEVFLGLRSEGIDVAGFRKRYGGDLLNERRSRIESLLDEGMAVVEGGILKLTSKGYMMCDEISASLEF